MPGIKTCTIDAKTLLLTFKISDYFFTFKDTYKGFH